MLIRLKKVQSGVVLSCIRDNASVAVQRTGHEGFFALHDLMHYAIETVLGIRVGFFGLMASGWEFENFTRRDDPRYRPIPPEAIVAENLVGTFYSRLADVRSGDTQIACLLAEEINADMAAIVAKSATPWQPLSVAQVTEVCTVFNELARRWALVGEGEHMQLEFPAVVNQVN